MNDDMKFTESTTVYKFYVNFEFILPLFIYMILKEIIKSKRKKKPCLVYYVPLYILLTNGYTHTLLYYSSPLNSLYVSVYK